MDIGSKIKTLRKNKKMTLEQLGEKVGLKKSTISVYEKNAINIPIDKLEKIAKALDTSINYLTSDSIQIDEDYVDTSMLSADQLEELNAIIEANNIMFFKGNKKTTDSKDTLRASITRTYITVLKKMGEL